MLYIGVDKNEGGGLRNLSYVNYYNWIKFDKIIQKKNLILSIFLYLTGFHSNSETCRCTVVLPKHPDT